MTTSRRALWGVTGVVAVAALVRLYGLGSDPFWLDEAHTANYTGLGLGRLWSFTDPFDRVNPPGYIVALKVWTLAGDTDAWYRLSSALAGIATVPVTYRAGRRLGGHRLGLVAAAFLALSGYHIRFSQEARAYAPLALLAAVAMMAVAHLIADMGEPGDKHRTGRRWAWAAYVLSAGAAFHLHNTGVVIPASATIATAGLWWRERPVGLIRRFVLANLAVVALWSPWIPGYLTQTRLVTESWWVPAPTPFSVAGAVSDLLAPSFGWRLPWNRTEWGAVAMAVVAGVIIAIGIRSVDRRYRLLLWAFLLTLPVMELVYGVRRPIFLTRTLLWVLVPASIALAAAALRPRRPAPAVAALLAVGVLGTAAYHLTFEKTAWDEAARVVAAGAGTTDLVLVQPSNTTVAFDHYFDETTVEVIGFPHRLPGRQDRGSTVTARDRAQVLELAREAGTVWLVLNNPDRETSLEPTLTGGAAAVERFELTDVVVIRFVIAP
jgi:4-amino-4-deoxy-L-arabinose transferase-like glycosyltransferase